MNEPAIIVLIIVAVILGVVKLDDWAKKRAVRKQIEEAKRAADAEEALFQNNLENLWTRPEDEDGRN